jgi:sulfoxide reductase heme-binding subunit YedZ
LTAGQGAARLNGWLRRIPVGPLYAVLLLPAAWWIWRGVTGRLGADPVRALEQELGLFALQLLIAALCVTPLREITGVSLLRFRRCLGLSAFWYACLHLAAWLSLDRQFDWARILEDLTKRPYVILGMTAFVLLIPLAATSSNAAIRRLGPLRWRALHRLAYPATLFAAIHFIWLVKAWPLEPLAYGAGVLALLAWRLRGRMARRGSVGA